MNKTIVETIPRRINKFYKYYFVIMTMGTLSTQVMWFLYKIVTIFRLYLYYVLLYSFYVDFKYLLCNKNKNVNSVQAEEYTYTVTYSFTTVVCLFFALSPSYKRRIYLYNICYYIVHLGSAWTNFIFKALIFEWIDLLSNLKSKYYPCLYVNFWQYFSF